MDCAAEAACLRMLAVRSAGGFLVAVPFFILLQRLWERRGGVHWGQLLRGNLSPSAFLDGQGLRRVSNPEALLMLGGVLQHVCPLAATEYRGRKECG